MNSNPNLSKTQYFEFSKEKAFVRILNFIIYTICILFGPTFIYTFAWMLILYVFDFASEKIFVLIFFGYAVWILCCIGFLIKDLHALKGVFLYDDHLEIVPKFLCASLPVRKKFRNIAYSDISCVEYTGSFYRDEHASYGKGSWLSNNYFGGDTGECVKIVVKDGLNDAALFSCKQNVELIRELKSRIAAETERENKNNS